MIHCEVHVCRELEVLTRVSTDVYFLGKNGFPFKTLTFSTSLELGVACDCGGRHRKGWFPCSLNIRLSNARFTWDYYGKNHKDV